MDRLIGNDPDDQEPPSVQIFCPECAAEEFAYRARREDSEDGTRPRLVADPRSS